MKQAPDLSNREALGYKSQYLGAPDLHHESTSDSKSQSFRAPDSSKSGAIGNESQSPWGARKKVLYLITKATWGGAQRYVYDLATNLPKKFEPIVAYGASGRLSEMLISRGIKTHHIPSLGRDIALFSDIASFFEILKCIRETRPHAVHLNSSKAAALGAFAARLAGVPKIIFTVHGWPFKEDRNSISRALIRFVSWLTALLSDDVIVVSKMDERLGRRMWGITKKVRHIHLGLAAFSTLPPPDAFRAMFGPLKPASLQSSTLRLTTIGELTPNKGLRYAIDAVAILSLRRIDTVFVAVGEGEEREALQAYAKKVGVSDRVFFPGFIVNAAQNLSGFDVFMLPSIKEGTPYVLLEAALAGVPIVATSAVDQGLVTQLSSARLVPTHDATALADAIVEVSRLPHTQEKHAKMFALDTMVLRTALLYI